MKILISGGGIAGLTLAYWLHRRGFQSIVIDKAVEFKRIGYPLGTYGISARILEKMGLLPTLKQQSVELQEAAVADQNGCVIRKFNPGKYLDIAHHNLVLNRADLHLTLYDAVKEQVEIRLGQTIQAVNSDPDNVTVTFANGQVETFDLLIGADGVHSATRDLVFGTDNFRRYFNVSFMAFFSQQDFGIGNCNYNLVMPRRYVGIGKYGQETGAFFVYPAAVGQQISLESRKSFLLDQFSDCGWVIKDVINSVIDPTQIFYDDMLQIVMPTWSSGRACLIGDAAHTLTLMSGKGAGMAILGAYVLAQALATSDYKTAFRSYEQQLRPGIEALQKDAMQMTQMMMPKSALAVALTHVYMRLIPEALFFRRMTKSAIGGDLCLDEI
ncbi:MAG: FAD-dependent monooxygenase [Cyanobacteria bacterium P01_C01_bin.118]